MLTACGTQTSDPKASKIPFPNATIAISECSGTNGCLFDGSQKLATTTSSTFSFLKQSLLRAVSCFSVSNSHCFISSADVFKDWERRGASGARSQSIDNVLRLGSADQASFTEHPLPLAVLLAEDMASIRASLGRQPGSCDLEAFLDSLVCLLLWHRSTMLLL